MFRLNFHLTLPLLLAILILAPCAPAVNPDPVSPPDNPCAPEAPGVTSADAGGGCPCRQRVNQVRPWGKPAARRDRGADGRCSENGYNADGRLIWTKDFNGNVTSFEHDDWGNVVKTIDALGNATTATFDAMGRRTSAADAMGATTRFAYDQRSRLISIIAPLGNETKMEHDAAGNLTKETASNGVVTLHEYDAMNREIKTTVNAADAANAVVSTREYDVAGRAVRHCVIDRKVTQGTRGEMGERWCEHAWTAVMTCRKQGRSAFAFFLDALRAYTNDAPAPSLLKNP